MGSWAWIDWVMFRANVDATLRITLKFSIATGAGVRERNEAMARVGLRAEVRVGCWVKGGKVLL